MEQNYIDRRRTTSISKAWLIERCITQIRNVCSVCDWYRQGLIDCWKTSLISDDKESFTLNKNECMRFVRWIDAKRFIDTILQPNNPFDNVRFTPTFHTDLIPLASIQNPTGEILHE